MMAMGNYPYESSYLTQGGAMPAWPIRAACRLLSAETSEASETSETSETSEASEGGTGNEAASSLIEAMVAAVGVYYNASGTADCYGRESIDGLWDYQCVLDLDLDLDLGGTDVERPDSHLRSPLPVSLVRQVLRGRRCVLLSLLASIGSLNPPTDVLVGRASTGSCHGHTSPVAFQPPAHPRSPPHPRSLTPSPPLAHSLSP